MSQGLPTELARHLRQLYFGGNWTSSNMKEILSDIGWQHAVQKTAHSNTIAALVYHINYFVLAASRVLEGQPLDAHDKFSFDVPPINSAEEWRMMVDGMLNNAEHFALLIEQLPANKLWEVFSDPKYGTYFRNILGIIEHSHYHLGQIAVIKKILAQNG